MRRCRVRAALRAAARRRVTPFVRTAFCAARLRDAALRRLALPRACLESARDDAALRPSRRRAPETARDRVREGVRRRELWPAL
jgi:hypothetical protein